MTSTTLTDSVRVFQDLSAVVVVVVDDKGDLRDWNAGFERLFSPGSLATKNVAEFFVLPSFNRLATTVAAPGQPLHQGLLTVGDIRSGCRSLVGTVHREGASLILIAEHDVDDLEAVASKMLQLNEELIETQRELSRKERQLIASEDNLRQLCLTDPLTGLANRRHLDEFLASECEREQRAGEGFSIIAADLDHFKRINDDYGHEGGDRVLTHFAQLLKANLRAIDLAARSGGEEFIVVMPMTGLDEAILTAERIRSSVSDMRVPGIERAIGASFGVAQSAATTDIAALVKQADDALYAAKQAGRNRVEPAPASRALALLAGGKA